jgi:hypothetical protein
LRCPKNGILPFFGLGVFAAQKPQEMETAGIHAGLKQRPPAVFSPFGVFAAQKLLGWKQPASMPA